MKMLNVDAYFHNIVTNFSGFEFIISIIVFLENFPRVEVLKMIVFSQICQKVRVFEYEYRQNVIDPLHRHQLMR